MCSDLSKCVVYIFSSISFVALVSFDPTSYTVIEGVDEFVLLGLVRSGDISGSTTVDVETLPGTAMGTHVYE